MKVREKFYDFLFDERYTYVANIIINATVGLVLGPTSFGLTYYILFVLAYEILIILVSQGRCFNLTNPTFRLAYICAGFAGYIFGRSIAFRFAANPLTTGNIIYETKDQDD